MLVWDSVLLPEHCLRIFIAQGIKITDAASKRKVKEILSAEAAMRKMDVESTAGWEEGAPSDMDDDME